MADVSTDALDGEAEALGLTFAPGCTFSYVNVHGDRVVWTRGMDGWTSPDRDAVATDDDVRRNAAGLVADWARAEVLAQQQSAGPGPG